MFFKNIHKKEMIIVIDSIILVFLFTIYHQIYSNKIIVKIT